MINYNRKVRPNINMADCKYVHTNDRFNVAIL